MNRLTNARSGFFPFHWFLTLTTVGLSLMGSAVSAQDELANVIEKSEKSVVRIEVKTKAGGGLGSGFVVDPSGIIVTNVHVLAGAEEAVAIFPNGKRFEITGTKHIDIGRDICVAVMDVDEKLTPIKLASALPRKGETVIALGAPLGLSFTATTGIISAIRDGKELGKDIGDSKMDGTWAQVDAALSPGNSGGPLINRKGEVVAMSTRASTGVAQNLNFGISIIDITAAILKSAPAQKISLSDGVGEIDDHEVGGGESEDTIISRRDVPKSSLAEYIQTGKTNFNDLAKKIRKEATAQDRLFREMKKGRVGFPQTVNAEGQLAIAVQGRTKKTYFFRSQSVKDRLLRDKEARVKRLKELKSLIADASPEDALQAILKDAGPRLDPQKKHSVGFMVGAIVLHPYNDHDIVVVYNDTPFLMWLESTSGLSLGEELSPRVAFVAGTETLTIPGRSSMSVTVLQSVTEKELDTALGGSSSSSKSQFVKWKSKSGTYEIEAAFVKKEDNNIHLKKRDGTVIQVPMSKLDPASLKYAK